ncbi:hypothetical protein GCM10018966_025610 [Streptomyces yanii]
MACTLAGFVLTSAVDINPALGGLRGATVLAVRLWPAPYHSRRIVRAAAVPFLAFVLALGLVVRAGRRHGLASGTGATDTPADGTGTALLGITVLAAVAGQLHQQPAAVLVLLPLDAPSGRARSSAVLCSV